MYEFQSAFFALWKRDINFSFKLVSLISLRLLKIQRSKFEQFSYSNSKTSEFNWMKQNLFHVDKSALIATIFILIDNKKVSFEPRHALDLNLKVKNRKNFLSNLLIKLIFNLLDLFEDWIEEIRRKVEIRRIREEGRRMEKKEKKKVRNFANGKEIENLGTRLGTVALCVMQYCNAIH